MQRPQDRTSSLFPLIGAIAIVAALYFAKSVLIPIALAGLIGLLLTPIVNRLEKFGLGRIGSVAIVTAGSAALVAAFAWVLMAQVSDLATKLPEYRSNITAKTSSLGPVSRYLSKASADLQQLGDQALSSAQPKTAAPAPQVPNVQVVEPPPTPMEMIGAMVMPLVTAFANALIVFILVVFLLLYRRDLGDRLVQIFGMARVHVTNQAMGDAAENVSRYLSMLAVVNGTYGIVLTIVMTALGVPNPFLWGLAAALLRFIPYVGPWLGIAVPFLLSLAVFDSWTRPLILFGTWLAIELLTGNVLEVWVYGTKTAISPLGVIFGALFWTWLWGPAGLILGVPLTVSVVVLGRFIPQFRYVTTLFGRDVALDPRVTLYHRLLAPDADAAGDIVQKSAKDKPLEAAFDEILLPALALAEQDRHAGNLDEDRAAVLMDNLKAIVADLGEIAVRDGDTGIDPSPEVPVLIVPAADAADEVCGLMLQECLQTHGVRAETVSAMELWGDRVLAEREDAIIFISALPPGSGTPSRILVKRIRSRRPHARIIVGVWTAKDDLPARVERVAPEGEARLVATMAEAVAEIRGVSASNTPAREPVAASPR